MNNKTKTLTGYNNAIMLTILSIVLIISILSIKTLVTAKDNHSYTKQFISYEIKEGDTLHSIALQYCFGTDYNSYINEVKSINNLNSSTIHEGCYLLVPSYVEE